MKSSLKCPQTGAIAGWVLSIGTLGLIIVVATLVALFTFGKNVPPGYMGLRQTVMGPTAGYEKVGYGPGLYLTVPFFSTVHLIPEGVRILTLEDKKALQITTVEGAMVDLGVSIITRINRVPTDDIGGPADLVQSLTVDDTQRWDAHIQSIAEEALLDAFSKLLASEFYLPEKRLEASENAILRIRPRLAKVGIALEAVLVHNFNYQRSEIESAISAKNIQVKEKELNKALSRLAKVDAELSESEAKLKADMDIERTKGEQMALRISSEAGLREAENKAKGDELVALAESKVKSETAQLLADQKAASRLIAEQMAPLLASLKGGVVSNIDPYNLNDWAVRFGIEKGIAQE
jgi:hypothetical protein